MRKGFVIGMILALLAILILSGYVQPAQTTASPRSSQRPDAAGTGSAGPGGAWEKPYPGFTGDPYTRDPKQLITQEYFGNEWVNTIPEDATVPSPYVHHGYISGSSAKLTPYSGPKGMYDYYATLAKTSPRVKMWNIGKSFKGLDMYIVAVSSADTIKRLDQYQQNLRKLADPRKLGYPANARSADTEAEQLIGDAAKTKPIFWIFGKVHSNETGGGEMLMELAYRLAVDKRPMFEEIRNNLIVFITDPNPDGTDMVAAWVDRYMKDPVWKDKEPNLPFYNWYTQHDDNRETFINSQPEWKNVIKANSEWPTQVQLQLHEQDFLQATTGNLAAPPQADPIAQTELQWLASRELTQMEAFGMPGVSESLLATALPSPFSGDMMAFLTNGVGKHYETFAGARPGGIGGVWHPYKILDVGPPLPARGTRWAGDIPLPYFYPKIAWSFRNNINYSETGALTTAREMARNREVILQDYWVKCRNSVSAPGTTQVGANGAFTYAYAYVVPSGQKDMPDTVNMINNLLENGIEIRTAQNAFSASKVTALSLPPNDIAPSNGSKTYPAGSYLILVGQPYAHLVSTLLDPAAPPADRPPPGDSGWQYGLMRGVAVDRVDDPAVLTVPSALISDRQIPYPYAITDPVSAGYYAISHNSINNIVTLVFSLAKDGYKSYAAEESNGSVKRGDVLVPADQKNVYAALKSLVPKLGLTMRTMAAATAGKLHELNVPRIALFHSWDMPGIMDGGWSRFTFDKFNVPYTIIQRTDVLEGNLRSKFDVIFLPDTDAMSLKIGGREPAGTFPDEVWYGPVQTKQRNGGLGDAGIAELKKYVDAGGLLICNNASSELPIAYGFIKDVTFLGSRDNFRAPGALVRILPSRTSPITYGADDQECLYQDNSPVFTAPAEWVVASYPNDPAKILLGGALQGGEKLAGKAAIVDARAKDGSGRVILFGTDITYRWQAHGTYFLLWNAILNWDDCN